MASKPRGPLERLWRAEQLMREGNVDEARPLIEALEQEEILPPTDRLTWQLLQSQLLITTGDYEASRQLAEQVWQESKKRGKLLQAVDACIIATEALVEDGNYEESAKAIAEGEQMLEAVTDETPAALTERKASFIHLRGRLCYFKSEGDQAMDYLQQGLALRQELGNKHAIAVSLRSIGVVHNFKGDVDQSFKCTQQALKLFQEVGDKYYMALCLTNIGVSFRAKAEYGNALKSCQQGLALSQELGNKIMIAYSLQWLGRIYFGNGDLDQALDCYQQQRPIVGELGNKWDMAAYNAHLGELYLHRGEIDQAEECYQRVVTLAHELGHRLFIASGHGNLGLIHWQKGALEQALAHLEEDLRYHEEQGNNVGTGNCLYWLILVSLDKDSKGSRKQAQQYLERLQHIHEQEDHKGLSQAYRVAQALVLKASPRIRDKVRAQELLQQIAEEEEMIDFYNTQLAMVNLCELLLDELKAYGELNVLQEASSLVDRLYSLAQDRHSLSLVVSSLILKAKFAMIEGDLIAATRYLEQARVTAEEKNLGQLAEKATAETRQLEAQFDTWEQLIQRNAPIKERVEHARIADYLNDVEKLVSVQRLELSS
ncbi:MAG: tetratricopeptide repeat protein [Candidatus Hodarchaeales archaeon]|jgi:tetratricopeptide (TPR) repeat protein